MVHLFVIVYEFVEYVCGVYDYLFKFCVAGWDITYCANMYAHGPQSGPFSFCAGLFSDMVRRVIVGSGFPSQIVWGHVSQRQAIGQFGLHGVAHLPRACVVGQRACGAFLVSARLGA